jgi:endoplasmic reticulum resident protein 44
MRLMPHRFLDRLTIPRFLWKGLFLVLAQLAVIYSNNPTNSGAVELESSTFDNVIASTDLVFINFYADWCRFSNMLAPIFNEAADKINAEFPDRTKVILGRVDCDRQGSISSRYKVSKYPTLKLIRNGVPVKKEYRGARTADAFLEYIKQQLENPLKQFTSLQELMEIDDGKKRCFIGYMIGNETKNYEMYKKVAANLKDECTFYVGFGDASKQMHPPEQDIIAFRPDRTRSVESDETFQGDISNYDDLFSWIQAKCVPLVREITFENAEELTEEGLPFLILFHHPDDTESVKRYNQLIQTELMDEKPNINFLTADGVKFAHPLHHLGKSSSDLPLIAIDSFKHMYVANGDINQPGVIKKFLTDLHSGKLHREFHYGPDPSDPQTESDPYPTSPHESAFKNLGPSRNRYTLLKDEL